MIETTAEKSVIDKYNPNNLPKAGSDHVGKYFNQCWEKARKEKIGRLGLHKRWLDLHAAVRGKRAPKKYPRVGVNHLFKIIEAYCATLTEKVPIAEFVLDNADDEILAKCLDNESQDWWNNTEQQGLLFASTKNMQLYGTTCEKGVYNPETGEPEILLRDNFNIFPAPGFLMCDLNIPYLCDIDMLYPWEIRSKYGIPEDVVIPSDAEDQLVGSVRETTKGGKSGERDTGAHYTTNYASIDGIENNEAIKGKTLVVEIWVQDKSMRTEPIMKDQPAIDPATGQMIVDPMTGQPMMQQVEVGSRELPVYRDGIRHIVLCPALLSNTEIKGILDDSPNPTINWNLLQVRIDELVASGRQVPAVDPNGQPVIDPTTGQPAVQIIPVSPEEAEAEIYDKAKLCFPYWGKYPYSIVPSRVDTSQWWGFSIIEQLEESQGKIELMLTKYLTALEHQMFPILLNPQGSGVKNSEISNDVGLILNPTVATAAGFRYLERPQPPNEYLAAIQFLMNEQDIISMTPEVSEGRRPTGISAASAIIALQDKAATLANPQIRQVDTIVRNRGRLWAHFKMNFDTATKQIRVENQIVQFKGIDIFSRFNFIVESGSSAPITKAGRRQQFVELRKIGDMDRLSLLEMLEIPNAKLINERLVQEQGVPGALKLLAEAGCPIPVLQQVQQIVMQEQMRIRNQGGTGQQNSKTPEKPKAGGYSEGMTAANDQMAEIREG